MKIVPHSTLVQRMSIDRHAIIISSETMPRATNFVPAVYRASEGRRTKTAGRVTLNIVDLLRSVKDESTRLTAVRLFRWIDDRRREEVTFLAETETNPSRMIQSLVDEQRERIESIARQNRLKEIHFLLTVRLIRRDDQSPEHSVTREFRKSLANQHCQTIEKGSITRQRHLTREHFTHRQISLQPIGNDSHELFLS